MADYERKLLPSDDKANYATFRFGNVDCIGFVSHQKKAIEIIPMIVFEELMDFYMRSYLPNQRKH